MRRDDDGPGSVVALWCFVALVAAGAVVVLLGLADAW